MYNTQDKILINIKLIDFFVLTFLVHLANTYNWKIYVCLLANSIFQIYKRYIEVITVNLNSIKNSKLKTN